LVDGVGVRLRLGVRGQSTVDAGDARGLSSAFAGGDDQVGLDGFDLLAGGLAAQHGVEHVVGDDGGPAAVAALSGGGVESFADAVAFGLGEGGEEREQDAAVAGEFQDEGAAIAGE
jgi:hypothetical protein